MNSEGDAEKGMQRSTENQARGALWNKVVKQVGASVFFGVSSILIITVNKTVLTSFQWDLFYLVRMPHYQLWQ